VNRYIKEFISKVSFPLVGNPSEERLRTSRSDKLGSHTYVLISKLLLVIFMLLFPAVANGQALGRLDTIRWEHAQRYKLYGGVELSYKNYEEEHDGTTSEQKSFSQQYVLGLSGYVWRPRLMIFSSDISFVATDQDPFSKSRGINFGFNTTIFPRTRHPLILYANRTTSSLDGYLGFANKITTTSYGVRFGYSTFRNTRITIGYGHSRYESEDNGLNNLNSFSEQDTFGISLLSEPERKFRVMSTAGDNSNADNSNSNSNNSNSNNSNNSNNRRTIRYDPIIGITWGLNYEFLKFRTDRNSFSFQDETTHRFRLFAKRDLWNFFKGYSELNLYKKEEYKSLNFILELERNTDKFRTYNSYNYSLFEYNRNQSSTHNIGTRNTYYYTRNLLFHAGLSYARYTSDFSDPSAGYNANLGVSYSKYFKNYIMQAYLNTGFNSSDRDTENNYSASYGLTINSVSKMTRFLTYNYAVSYIGSYSSTKDSTNNLSFDIYATKAFRYFALFTNAGFEYWANSTFDSQTSKGYSLRLNSGLHTRLSSFSLLTMKADYTFSHSDSLKTVSLIIQGNLSIFLLRNLDLNIDVIEQFNQDSDGYDYRKFEALTSLNYRWKKLSLHGEFNISKENDNGSIIKKRTIFLRATRVL